MSDAEKAPKTTEQIRTLYTAAYAWRVSDDTEAGEADLSGLRAEQHAEFDHWLAAHDAEVRAAALEEAADWARDFIYQQRRTDYGDDHTERIGIKAAEGVRALRSTGADA